MYHKAQFLLLLALVSLIQSWLAIDAVFVLVFDFFLFDCSFIGVYNLIFQLYSCSASTSCEQANF